MEITQKNILFNSLEFDTEEVLNNFIETLTKEQAIFLLTEACNFAFKKGAYNLLESELVSKSLRVIHQPTK